MPRHRRYFYNAKDIFLEIRAYKKAKAEVTEVGNLVRTQLSNVDKAVWWQVIMAVDIRN